MATVKSHVGLLRNSPNNRVGPRRLVESKLQAFSEAQADDAPEVADEKLKSIEKRAGNLMRNPYTVHQVADFMKVAPLLKIYRLSGGKIVINKKIALDCSRNERLSRPEFDIDELSIWNRAVKPAEILEDYSRSHQPVVSEIEQNSSRLIAASFNIHHGGKHETIEEDGWDSRVAIADLIRREKVDVIMMQETYSSGDFIAAELGYYFATTVDWDYLNQGANISVLSRYPIEQVFVPPSSPFMNVCVKVSISENQEIFVMSNWYGMRDFPKVFDYHRERFSESDSIPTLFGGDFNAVPHTDAGKSPASLKLMDAGFTDAFRSLHPDVTAKPGATHENGRRIDQLYFKGLGLRNISTEVLSAWPSKFPSDHFLIKSTFELNYSTKQ